VEAMGTALTDTLDADVDASTMAARRTHAASFTWRRTAELTVSAYRRAMA
jgi:hypothetical protein